MAWDGYAEEAEGKLGLTTWSGVYLQSPTPVTQYYRIPAVMVMVVVAEGAIVWLVRRTVRRPRRR
jgi:hypothetical protein